MTGRPFGRALVAVIVAGRVLCGPGVAAAAGSVGGGTGDPATPEVAEPEAGEDVVSASGERPSFVADVKRFPSRLVEDVVSLATLRNGAILGVAGGLAAVSAKNWDRPARDEIASGPQRFGREPNSVLDNGGESIRQLAAAGGLYAVSVVIGEPLLHETSRDAIHALAIEIPALIGLKQAFNSTRPDGARRGFPSGHVASTAALAAVLHENLGPWVGSLGYAFTAAVAFHRMDTKNHDLSDVIFGGAIGYVIGSSAARNGRPDEEDAFALAARIDPASGLPLLAVEASF